MPHLREVCVSAFKLNASCTDIQVVSVHQPIVVVIDDDPDFVEFIASIIEGENCRSVVATDGLTGLLLAREVRAKLVLCDYQMPGFDGTQVIQAMQEDPVIRDVPRVLMSGHGCPDLRAVPADAFIAKPIDTQALRRLVRAFTRQREGEFAGTRSQASHA